MNYLGLITRTSDGYAGLIPELTILASDDTREAVQQDLREALALYLHDEPGDVPAPQARQMADLPKEVRDDYAGTDVEEYLVEPAPMNPVSLAVEQAIERSGLSYRELARQMGTGHAAISRMTDPFYWGHSMATLNRLAAALGLQLTVSFNAA